MNRTFILVTSLLCSLCCAAYDLEVDGIYYNYNATTQEAYVTNGDTRYTGRITIPSELGRGVPVTGIGDEAFAHCYALHEVNLPASITSIGSKAFYGCSALKAISLPNSVISIGQSAFEECQNLAKAEFSSTEHLFQISYGNETANPLSVAHHLYVTGEEEEVTELVVPKFVTSIGHAFFRKWSALKSIVFHEKLTSIADESFSQCMGLTSVSIPKSVTSIGQSAFYGCTGMTEVTIMCEYAVIHEL
ncbi:MAG: leucine-rich repeat domain-containing protein, partial [Bacteroidaceae bacterium]|nr:leucine-rich repeat domain-containing protein [Bacteroidaceae bacterium]